MQTIRPPLPYRALRPWLEARFGKPVRRVSLDQGSDCPNRDGTKGFGGCFYCDVEGSGTGALRAGVDLERQLQAGLARIQRTHPDCAAVAYLQSYSNTYVEPARLDLVLDLLEPHLGSRIVALSVATRPDTLPDWALDRLERLRDRVDVWIELGLESASDEVLRAINRLHTTQEFRASCARVKARGLQLVGHAILGLPGDGREGAVRTAQILREVGADGVKVHQLMVLERTVFANWWRQGRLQVLQPEEYVAWLADFLEHLDPEQVIHRITGDAEPEKLLAPRWPVSKNGIRDLLVQTMHRRGTRQGWAGQHS